MLNIVFVQCYEYFLCFIFTQTSLESEKERADDLERKYNEAQASSEERGKKLEETEKKLRQLQESLTR